MWKTFIRGNGEKVAYQIKRTVCTKKTKFQLVEILDTKSYGLALFLDHMPQSSEVDEFVYHEGLVHPALITHPNPQNILIAGGGEGATLREVLRHKTINHATMIDLDKNAVELCKRYLVKWHCGSFDNPKVELLHQDARRYLERTDQIFNCIFIDVTDPLPGSPSYLLYTKEFYQTVYERLSPDGIIVTQAESANINNLTCFLAITKTLSQIFPIVRPYRINVPFYADLWGFVLASKKYDPFKIFSEKVDRVLKNRGCQGLKFYDGETHRAIFSLPKYLRSRLKGEKRVITDNKPIFFLG